MAVTSSGFLLAILSSLIVSTFSQDVTGHSSHIFERLHHLNNPLAVENCPNQPIPVDLPSQLPDIINDALVDLAKLGQTFVNSTNIPGVVIGVTYKGKTLWTKGFGVKDKKHADAPPDENTIFRIGSISKIFPVIMLYQLYKEGTIKSLDDPLEKYAPDFKINNPFSKSSLTLRQMASQLSGLPREAPCGIKAKGLNVCPLTSKDVLKTLSNWYVLSPSWTRPSYSNLAYSLLGNLLNEYHSKWATFEEYAMNHIIQPLELTSTGFKFTDNVKRKMAVGYMPNGDVAPLIDLGFVTPAGQMYSSINDLNKLSQFFYESHLLPFQQLPSDSDDVLSFDMRREMSLPYYVNPDGKSGFGTPWEIAFKGNYTIRTKGGNINGYSAIFSFIPELHLGVNALFSGAADEFTFTEKAYDILLSPFVTYLSTQQNYILPFPPNPQIYIGSYSDTRISAFANITAKDNKLYLISEYNGQRLSTYLAYHAVDLMQVYYPPNLLPCLTSELTANLGEWLYFDPVDDSGKSPAFSVPPAYLKRID